MKVLHLTHTFIPTDSRILKEMVALASSNCHTVCGIGVAPFDAPEKRTQPQGIEIHSLELRSRRWRGLPALLRQALALVEWYFKLLLLGTRQKPQVVHCHDTPALLAGLFISRLCGARLVYDAHELESQKNGQSRWMSSLTLSAEKLAWPFVDHLVSVSPSILDWYRTSLGPKPSTLILNSPEITQTVSRLPGGESEQDRYFHQRFNIPADARVFLYLGLLVPGRGIEMLLEAFSNESLTSHVVFMGSGSLAPLIAQRSSTHVRVHLHPPVPHQEVVSVSRSADHGLCVIERISMSDYFCLPNKLFEYAFAGVPVLASKFPDIARVVEEHALGDCFDPDPSSLVETIARVERMPRAAAMKNLEQLSWQAQCHRLLQAYEGLEY